MFQIIFGGHRRSLCALLVVAVCSTPAFAQDSTAPRIAEIQRQTPQSPSTADDSLTWRVSFDEAVSTSGLTLQHTDDETDAAGLFLEGSLGLAAANVDGTPYAFVPGFFDDGLSVVTVNEQGNMQFVFNVADDENLFLDAPTSATTVEIDGTVFLYVGSRDDDGVSVFSVGANGSLTNVQNIADDGFMQLSGVSDFHFAEIAGTRYMFVTGSEDWGVSVFSIGNDGHLTSVFNVTDSSDPFLRMSGAGAVTTAVVDGTTYLYVVGSSEHGLSVFSVANDGSLTNVHNITDNPNIYLNGASNIESAVIDGNSYIYLSGTWDLGFGVFSVDADGDLTSIQNIEQIGDVLVEGPKEAVISDVNGRLFLTLAASSPASNSPNRGIQIFSIGGDGRLTPIVRQLNTVETPMFNAAAVSAVPIENGFLLFVSNSRYGGMNAFRVELEPIGADDFAVTGTTAGLGVNILSPTMIDVTASGGDLAGLDATVALGLADDQNITDFAGNALVNGTPLGANESFIVDNTPPDVSLSHNGTLPVDAPFTLTVTFTEDVSGFALGDIVATNATLSNFQTVSGSVYTATVTPGGQASVGLSVAGNVATDAAGHANTAAAPLDLASVERRTLNVELPGLGAGMVTSSPAGIDCENDCSERFLLGQSVTLTATAAFGSQFAGWVEGPCAGSTDTECTLSVNADTSVAARFTTNTVPEGRIVAATLPAARSGYVGGPAITVFMSVVSRATTPAQSCTISAPDGSPVTLAYRRVDANNAAIGAENPVFDLVAGGTASFVLELTPVAETTLAGVDFQPAVTCENASLGSVVGLNTIFLSIQNAPVPDILSISTTASGDGVIRISEAGRAGLMTAAVVNIGAGDGSAGASGITLTTTADTGSASLPVTIEICQINEAAQCITPRGPSVTTANLGRNEPAFFAAFVRDNSGGAGIAFDPANARIFLRFSDASGTVRSATSAAVTVPPAQ